MFIYIYLFTFAIVAWSTVCDSTSYIQANLANYGFGLYEFNDTKVLSDGFSQIDMTLQHLDIQMLVSLPEIRINTIS